MDLDFELDLLFIFFSDLLSSTFFLVKKEYYELTVEEIEASYNRASQKFTEEIIDGMVDKELLQVSVAEDGEFLYSLTDKGREYKNNWLDE